MYKTGRLKRAQCGRSAKADGPKIQRAHTKIILSPTSDFSREHASQKPSQRYYEALNASYVHRMANFEQTKYTFKMTSQSEVGFQRVAAAF